MQSAMRRHWAGWIGITIGITICGVLFSQAQAGPLREAWQQRHAAEQAASPRAAHAERAGRGMTGESDINGERDDAEAPSTLILPPGAQRLSDVAYGPDARQRFDVYLPAPSHATPDAAPHAAPVIFMVHGGGWRRGDKTNANVVDNKVARWVAQGMVLVSVNYRLLPDADPLQQARDVAQALAAAQKQAVGWGADPAHFVLMGHSAGAHLVALLASAPQLAAEAGARPWLGSVLLDTAVLDVPRLMAMPHFPLYDKAFGSDPDYWRQASPLQQLQLTKTAAAPLLAVCSTKRTESCRQAQAYVRQARSLGTRADTLGQDLSHADINRQLGTPGAYTRQVENFLRSLDASLAAHLPSANGNGRRG